MDTATAIVICTIIVTLAFVIRGWQRDRAEKVRLETSVKTYERAMDDFLALLRDGKVK